MKNKLSKHGSKRYVERFDIKDKQQQRDFRNAIRKGIPPQSLKQGELRNYLMARLVNGKKIMYYKDRAYVYKKTNTKNILITVYDVSSISSEKK